jgi:hypothetical protein
MLHCNKWKNFSCSVYHTQQRELFLQYIYCRYSKREPFMIQTASLTTTRYAFRQHTQRMGRTATIAAITLLISGCILLLAFANALPQGLGTLVALAFVLAVVSFIMLIPLVLFFYGYNKGGLWLGEQGVRVQFPGEAEQQLAWSDALYAVDEGDEYLTLSKGKEGLGHLIGKDYYVRLHLEGMTPEQCAEIRQRLAEHVEVRQPHMFTFATLYNDKSERVARGRLYLFENELLCAENRNQKRVFIAAPLHKLTFVRKRESFAVGNLECEAFVICYDKKDYVVMLGYETTHNTGFGISSRWAATGSAQEWVEALQPALRVREE